MMKVPRKARKAGRSLSYLIRRVPPEVREHIEDLKDLAHIRVVVAETKAEDLLPVALVRRMLNGEHPIRIWRQHRGLSMNELARRSGVNPAYLSEIENERKPGSVHAFAALARTLGVHIDDLIQDRVENETRRGRRAAYPA